MIRRQPIASAMEIKSAVLLIEKRQHKEFQNPNLRGLQRGDKMLTSKVSTHFTRDIFFVCANLPACIFAK